MKKVKTAKTRARRIFNFFGILMMPDRERACLEFTEKEIREAIDENVRDRLKELLELETLVKTAIEARNYNSMISSEFIAGWCAIQDFVEKKTKC
jgi:hypothetical protein